MNRAFATNVMSIHATNGAIVLRHAAHSAGALECSCRIECHASAICGKQPSRMPSLTRVATCHVGRAGNR